MNSFNKLLIGTTATMLLLFTTCTPSKNDEKVREICINVEQDDSYDSFFQKEYQAIPLETSDDVLVGEIEKIQLTNDHIYVFDKEQKTIFTFDLKGNFERKYCHIGQGEGEYPYLSDFEVYGNHLYILSRFNKCIYVYTLDDKYVKEIDTAEWYEKFRILDNNHLLLYSDYSNNILYNFILFDYQKEEIEDKYLPFKQNESFSLAHKAFHEDAKGGILLSQLYDYNIYQITDRGINRLCMLSFNTADHIPEKAEEQSLYQLHNSLKGKSVVKFLDCITLKDSTVYFTYRLDYKTNIAKVDLNTGAVKNTQMKIVEEFPFAFLGPLMFWKANAISVCDAESVIRMSDTPFPSDKTPDGLLHEDDNPVIFIRELK